MITRSDALKNQKRAKNASKMIKFRCDIYPCNIPSVSHARWVAAILRYRVASVYESLWFLYAVLQSDIFLQYRILHWCKIPLNRLSACLDYQCSNLDSLFRGSVNVCVSELSFWVWLLSGHLNHLSASLDHRCRNLDNLSSCSVNVCVSELLFCVWLFSSYSNHLSSCLFYQFVCGLSFRVSRMSTCLNHLSRCPISVCESESSFCAFRLSM